MNENENQMVIEKEIMTLLTDCLFTPNSYFCVAVGKRRCWLVLVIYPLFASKEF